MGRRLELQMERECLRRGRIHHRSYQPDRQHGLRSRLYRRDQPQLGRSSVSGSSFLPLIDVPADVLRRTSSPAIGSCLTTIRRSTRSEQRLSVRATEVRRLFIFRVRRADVASGYMVNWLMGHNPGFSVFVCHDGVFSPIQTFFATEELYFRAF